MRYLRDHLDRKLSYTKDTLLVLDDTRQILARSETVPLYQPLVS